MEVQNKVGEGIIDEINIHTGEYASLGDWYNNVKVKENEVELKNDYSGKSMILKNVKELKWS